MGGHGVRALDVHRDELLPRAGSVEHRVRTAGSPELLRMDCEGPQLPADADQHRGDNPMHRRVDPAFWLTTAEISAIIHTYTKQTRSSK